MKKLIMFLAVTLTVGISQAAFVNWAINLGKEEGAGKTFYVFSGSQADTVLSLLGNFDATKAADTMASAIATGTLNTKAGKFNAKEGADIGSESSLFMLVLDGALEDGGAYIAGTMDVSSVLYTPPASASGTFEAAKANFTKSGKITAAGTDPVTPGGVPEPTSGLLLVLGGAALALRRKQK